MLYCTECKKELVGKQRKFCSNKCKGKNGNNRYQNYAAQQTRGLQRKVAAIKIKGGRCQICGYNKNLAALCFHHKRDKSIRLDSRSFANNSAKAVMAELKKCDLLCTNCHLELHNPQLDSNSKPIDLVISQHEFIEILANRRRPKRKINRCSDCKINRCSDCGTNISRQANNCSACQNIALQKIQWPATTELIKMVEQSSYIAVGKQLGVSDNAIRKRIKNHPSW